MAARSQPRYNAPVTPKTQTKFSARLLAPRHWPAWLAIGLLRLSTPLPYAWQLRLGAWLGRRLFSLTGRRRRLTRYNLAQCFPELDEAQREQLARRHFESLGIGLLEIAQCWWGNAAILRQRVQMEGLAHLQAALAQGRGAVLLSAHTTTLEIGGRLLGLFTPFHLMYRPNNSPVLEWIISRRRRAHFEGVIPRDDVRQLLKSLKDNKPVWYAPDQGFTGKNHVIAPFFGVPAPTNPATSRIAKASDAPVLPFLVERLPDKQGYRLSISPPLPDFPGADLAADAARVNAMIEEQVRCAPEQYLWMHNRFKTRDYRKLD